MFLFWLTSDDNNKDCSSEFWRRVDSSVDANVSEKHAVSIFRAERCNEQIMLVRTSTSLFQPVKPAFNTLPATCLALDRMLGLTLKPKKFHTLPYSFWHFIQHRIWYFACNVYRTFRKLFPVSGHCCLPEVQTIAKDSKE
jgi:hypothetical protein